MTGRELKRHNDLFYLCALIEYIARETKNRNRVIVNALGEERLTKIFKLADIYHSLMSPLPKREQRPIARTV